MSAASSRSSGIDAVDASDAAVAPPSGEPPGAYAHLAPCAACGALNGISARQCWSCEGELRRPGARRAAALDRRTNDDAPALPRISLVKVDSPPPQPAADPTPSIRTTDAPADVGRRVVPDRAGAPQGLASLPRVDSATLGRSGEIVARSKSASRRRRAALLGGAAVLALGLSWAYVATLPRPSVVVPPTAAIGGAAPTRPSPAVREPQAVGAVPDEGRLPADPVAPAAASRADQGHTPAGEQETETAARPDASTRGCTQAVIALGLCGAENVEGRSR